jgi:hypothetical protein
MHILGGQGCFEGGELALEILPQSVLTTMCTNLLDNVIFSLPCGDAMRIDTELINSSHRDASTSFSSPRSYPTVYCYGQTQMSKQFYLPLR